MATVTPNFNWPVPTSTDLVKDGATAIEALGDSIDASLVDLKGGTTGQVLSKNSNTDMDFVWVTDAAGDITGVTAGTGISGGGTSGTVTVTNSMATAIDAKGDLVPGTGADTFARLAVGANGLVLTPDSTETTGLKWGYAYNVGVNLGNSTDQLANNVTEKVLSMNTEFWDTNGFHDNTTNNSRLTVPNAGYYRFQFATLATNPQFYRHGFFKNGAQINTGFGVNGDQGTSGSASIDLLLAANDYVEIMVYIAGASTGFYGTNSFAIPTYFSCQYLGA